MKSFLVSFIYWNLLSFREVSSLVWAHFLVVFGNERVEINSKYLFHIEQFVRVSEWQLKKGCMFSFPAGCVGISLSFQEDPVNYCQQIYIFFILAALSTSKSYNMKHWELWYFVLSDFIWWPMRRSLLIIWSFYKNPSYIYFISSWNCCNWRSIKTN